jgi:hypothetical protein
MTVAIGRATDLDAAQAVLAAREVKYKAIRSVGLRVQAGGDSAKSKEFGLGGVILPTTHSITYPLLTYSLVHSFTFFSSVSHVARKGSEDIRWFISLDF